LYFGIGIFALYWGEAMLPMGDNGAFCNHAC